MNKPKQSENNLKIGIIGGTGAGELELAKGWQNGKSRNRYGAVEFKSGIVNNNEIVFINRHGKQYVPPSRINYRANILALKQLGVKYILATAAVGAINPKMRPGDFVLLGDYLDFTQSRPATFDSLSFIDQSEPYSRYLNQQIRKAARQLKIKIHPAVNYVCTEGPRFETKSEIRAFARLGADVVGMTQVPEVVLANEAGLQYAAIGVVTNMAAGLASKLIAPQEVSAVMAKKAKILSSLIRQTINLL